MMPRSKRSVKLRGTDAESTVGGIPELTEARNARLAALNVMEDAVLSREALRQSEEQFRRAIEDAPIPTIIHAEDGEVMQISRSWTELTGYAKEDGDVIQSWLTRAYGFGGNLVREAMKKRFGPPPGETMRAIVFDITTRGGEQRTWSFSASSPGTLHDGRNFSVGMAVDITERVRAEEALRVLATERQHALDALQAIYDNSPVGMLQLDRDLRYIRINDKLAAMNGIPAADHIGKTIFEVVPEISPAVADTFVKVMETGDAVMDVELSGTTAANPNTKHTWLESWWPMYDTAGNIAGINVSAHDITDRKRSEQLLRDSEERMRSLTDSFTDYAILSTDRDGIVESWNPGAANIFGFTEDEIIGQSAERLFTPEDVANGVPEEEMRKAREFGRALDERWHLRKDNSRFFASGVMVPLVAAGEHAGYAKIARDLTERRRQAEELQTAYEEMENRVRSRTQELAAANLSLTEEINERRSAERKRIGLLHRIVTSQEDERRRIARDLHDQLGQRLTALRLKLAALSDLCVDQPEMFDRTIRIQQIAELLDSEVGFLAWQIRPTALDELGLAAALETFVVEWSRHYSRPAEFHVSGIQGLSLPPEVETQIYRITQEALNNVTKHAKAESVSVILERIENHLVLIVEDDGVGFDPAAVEQLPTDIDGMGLAGMKERAELIDGEIEVESKGGSGTTIYLRVPLTTGDAGAGKYE